MPANVIGDNNLLPSYSELYTNNIKAGLSLFENEDDNLKLAHVDRKSSCILFVASFPYSKSIVIKLSRDYPDDIFVLNTFGVKEGDEEYLFQVDVRYFRSITIFKNKIIAGRDFVEKVRVGAMFKEELLK